MPARSIGADTIELMPMVALSELLTAVVRDSSGLACGRVREAAIVPQEHPTRVAFLIARTPDGDRMIPAEVVKSCGRSVRTLDSREGWQPVSASDGVLLLRRDLL